MTLALFRSMTGFSRSLLSLALLTGALSAQTVTPAIIEHYNTPSSIGAIAHGIDGAMWFCGNPMGAINPLGQVKTLPGLTCNGITEGPDGAMWFTYQSTQHPHAPIIGRISASGVVTGYPVPVAGQPDGAVVYGITTGSDGALWFTDQGESEGTVQGLSQIGRITVSGEMTMYPLPAPLSIPGAITAGPDGNLWFTEVGTIGRITPTGVITEFPVLGNEFPETPSLSLSDITTGPDGALWATTVYNYNEDYGAIMRVTTDGYITEYDLGTVAPYAIASGPNNSLWFFSQVSRYQPGALTSISTDGTITSTGYFPSYAVWAIATAADGSLWFTESEGMPVGASHSATGIGQVIMPTATLTARPAVSYPGSSLTVTGSGYAAGETVNLNANSTGAKQLGTATADSGGGFSVTVKVPELTISGIVGDYVWQTVVGVGGTSGKIAVAPYSVSPLIRPSSTVVSPGNSITVSGFGFGPNELLSMYWNTTAGAPPNEIEIWEGQTDEYGAFYGPTAVTITIPENTVPGSYSISVVREYPNVDPGYPKYITVQ